MMRWCAGLHGRVSGTENVPANLVKTALQIFVFWGFFLGLVPWVLTRFENLIGIPPFRSLGLFLVGVLIFAAMSALGIYCSLVFVMLGKGTPLPLDATTRFVVVGPYRFVRNPMAIAGIGQGIGVALILASPLTLLYALAGIAAWNRLAREWEERDLIERFGEPYAEYQRAVPCWVPTPLPYKRVI